MKRVEGGRWMRIAAVGVLIGCGEPESADEELGPELAIVRGASSSAAQDFVVMLQGPLGGSCSGTLIAPNVVLTARHCVALTDAEIACRPDGSARVGGDVVSDYDAASLVVYTGRRRDALIERARARRIVHDGADNLCNHDLALLELDRAIKELPVAAVRLEEFTTEGESLTMVGWGLTGSSRVPIGRLQRRNVLIDEVGPSGTLASNEFSVGESICSGDSGGPALSRSGAVVGVVSYGGNGSFDPQRPAASCLGDETRNTYTRLAPFASLVRKALRAAGHEPVLERPRG